MSRNSQLDSRRHFLRVGAASVGVSLSGWLGHLAAQSATDSKRTRACILLWMNGGPSQIDTFDPKPDHANGGPVRPIRTNVPDLMISEYLPLLAMRADKLAIIRSMATKEADHGRAGYLLRTGRVPGGPVRYPSLGSFVGKELEEASAELPSFVSIAPFRFLSPEAYGPGFLGPRYAPLVVGENFNYGQPNAGTYDVANALRVQDLDLPGGVGKARDAERVRFLDDIESDFVANRPSTATESHRTAYRRAVTLMRSASTKAFDLSGESPALRDKYGRNLFGQGCLLARRLVGARRAVHRSHPVRRGGQQRHRLGHAPGQLHQREEAVRSPRPRVVHAPGRPARPGTARNDHSCLDGRVRGGPPRSTGKRAATTGRTRGPRCWRAAEFKAGKRSARPARTGCK